ncbi:hypothetical protein JV173_03305 [Acholeplasma equirhinis]|uniref:hypothetical protein n=1 Tax=Acholeplasma equirhinis TaxID=555393 RepID=UPI00197AF09C|nr:hypothetical protein [Acholeplasma equirhinis]MBN3490536.1 hypothetical protein [Acholeplasma equirhinis]
MSKKVQPVKMQKMKGWNPILNQIQVYEIPVVSEYRKNAESLNDKQLLESIIDANIMHANKRFRYYKTLHEEYKKRFGKPFKFHNPFQRKKRDGSTTRGISMKKLLELNVSRNRIKSKVKGI